MNGERETIEQKVDIQTIDVAEHPEHVEYKDPVSEDYIIARNSRRGNIINEWGNIDKWRPLDTNAWGIKKFAMILTF